MNYCYIEQDDTYSGDSTTFTASINPPCKHTKGFFTTIPYWWWRKRVFVCEECSTIRTEDKEYGI